MKKAYSIIALSALFALTNCEKKAEDTATPAPMEEAAPATDGTAPIADAAAPAAE